MSAYKAFDARHYILQIVDRDGHVQSEVRDYCNPSIAYLHPNEKMCLINWRTGFRDKPTQDMLEKPVVLKQDLDNGLKAGTKVYGYYGWGSGAKSGITPGLTHDLVKETIGAGPVDGQRFGRIFMPNAIYGAAVGTLKVKIVKIGTIVEGVGPIDVGFDYYDEEIIIEARKTKLNDRIEAQAPDEGKDTYSTDQRVPLREEYTHPDGHKEWLSNGVWEEARPYIQEAINDLTTKRTPAKNVQYLNRAHQEWKAKLVKIEPMMDSHAFVAATLEKSISDIAMRLSASLPKQVKVYVAVPTTAKDVALPKGKFVLYRMPATAWNTFKAVTITKSDRAEIKRIAEMGLAQTTVVSPDFGSKGMGGIIKGLKEKTGYDIIMCADNIKMGSKRVGGKNTLRQLSEVTLTNAYFGMIAEVAPGHAVGVHPETQKGVKGDYDGDNMFVINCSGRPKYYAAVTKFPTQVAHKLPKFDATWSQKEERARLIIETMDDVIGYATNIMSTTFAWLDRARLARALGFSSVHAMDDQISYLCQIGEDLFKTDLSKIKSKKTGKGMSIEKVHTELGSTQSVMKTVLGKMAPWSRWKRDAYAFKQGIPQVADQTLVGLPDSDVRVLNCVPQPWDGTCAVIAKYVLPQLGAILTDPIRTIPLTEFQGWALNQSDTLLAAAAQFQAKYDGKINLNWSDHTEEGAVNQFIAWLDLAKKEFLATTGASEESCAHALWIEAHGARSLNAGASSVFLTFPEWAEKIVTEKPGLSQEQKFSVLVGLRQGVDALECEGEVKRFEVVRAGKAMIVKGFVPNNRAILRDGNAFAGIPTDKPQLPLGKVVVRIKLKDKASWSVEVIGKL